MTTLNDAITDRLKLLRREYTAWRITYQDGERAAQAAFTRMRQLEMELETAKSAYSDLLVNSGKEIRRLKELLNAMCGPGTAETMRRE